MKAAQRRSQELEREGLRLHELLLETAESVRRSYERTAETLEHLAETGLAEHARRRRQAAERSRRLAEEEIRDIAELRRRDSRKWPHGSGIDHRPDTGPS